MLRHCLASVQAAYALGEALMLHDTRNMAAAVAPLMDMHYSRDLLCGNSTDALLPSHGIRQA